MIPFIRMYRSLLLSLVLISAGYLCRAQTSSAEEKILLDMERLHSEAIAGHNGGYLNTIYHDQFRGVTANGSGVDKKALLEILKTFPPDVQFSIDELKASIYGYAGVTSGKLTCKAKDGSIISQTRFMHVYIKRNGQWKIIEGQGTAITP